MREAVQCCVENTPWRNQVPWNWRRTCQQEKRSNSAEDLASQAETVEKSRTEQGTEQRNCWRYSPDADEDAESSLSNQALDVSTVQNTDNTPEIVLRAIADVSPLAKVMRATKEAVTIHWTGLLD